MESLFWPAVVAAAALYAAVFYVGAVVARRDQMGEGVEELLLAGRGLPLWIGMLTMTATWVGGGYVSGTAEQAFASGPLWGAQAGIGYAVSLMVAGAVFARPMRERGYTTLVDPLDERYGPRVAGLLMIPAVLAELFWSAAILVALGTAFGTVVGWELSQAIVLSAAVAIAYTVVGGMRAVAYTDVLQLALIAVGLLGALPFVLSAAGGWSEVQTTLIEGFRFTSTQEGWSYGDWCLVLILGGIPWNVYFQRVLSARDAPTAARLSIGAGPLCIAMAIPPLLLGLGARSIGWEEIAPVGVATALDETPALVLPALLRYAVPPAVAVVALGALTAAVMSSVDSSILSAAGLLVWNGYRRLLRPAASEAELRRMVRVAIVGLGIAATGVALSVGSVASLWYLCGDVVYCVLFPQLALALFDPRASARGALAALVVSTTLRLGGGEPTLGIPAFLPWPDWSDAGAEFPFRTIAMAAGLVTAVMVPRMQRLK